MDLAEWWRARRWRALLELIDQLPTASRTREAIMNDPDEARLIAFHREYGKPGEKDEPWAPRLSEFDLHAVLLREIAHSIAALAGAKSPDYFPGPKTEADRQVEILAQIQTTRIGMRYGFSENDFR